MLFFFKKKGEGKEEQDSDSPARSSWNIGVHRSENTDAGPSKEKRNEEKVSKIQHEPDTNADYSGM